MTRQRTHFTALTGLLCGSLLVVGCGKEDATEGTTEEFVAAAPTYDGLAMDMTDEDSTAPTGLSEDEHECHPHLFKRTHMVVKRFNRHIYKYLRHLDRLLEQEPTLSTDTQRVWERERAGVGVRFTMTRGEGEIYTWSMELKTPSATDYVTVSSGQVDRSGVTGEHQGKGTFELDLTALNDALPNEHLSGALAVAFEVTADSRLLVVDATNIVWDRSGELDAPSNDTNHGGLSQPVTSHYVFSRKQGEGGSLKVQDKMVFWCPGNPDLEASDVSLLSRWYRDGEGKVRGRSDVLMSGGQLSDHGITRVVGVTCHSATSERGAPAEGQWLMKSQDAEGNTLSGANRAFTSTGEEACDPVFGAVPTLDSNANDFDFTQVDFTSDEPYVWPTPASAP